MGVFDLREPVNAWSHALWLLVSLPGTLLLWRRATGDRPKQVSLLVYGLSLTFCSAASTLYHSVRLPQEQIAKFALADYIGIYFLIGGSTTPIAWTLLRGRWKSGVLWLAWLSAASGTVLCLSVGPLPPVLSTGLYLAMGWGPVFCYIEASRRLSRRTLQPILVGGLLYSLGAVFNLMHRPVIWPGIFESHELFHVFVMAGSLVHYRFMLTVVAPYRSAIEEPSAALDSRVASPAPGVAPIAGQFGG